MALISSHAEIIDRILDKGIVTSNETLDLCCPDCVQNMNNNNVSIYVLASVETFLNFAEQLGCTPVPAIPNSTEQPFSSSYAGNCQCCTHIYASVETELKLYEAYSYQDEPNTLPFCSDNFNDCVNGLLFNEAAETVDRILDKGIVEYGSISGTSKICQIEQYIDLFIQTEGIDAQSSKAEIIDRMLDKGIVISCHNDEVIIASVETWLKSAEARGWFPIPAV
jgi:hypothetical protein